MTHTPITDALQDLARACYNVRYSKRRNYMILKVPQEVFDRLWHESITISNWPLSPGPENGFRMIEIKGIEIYPF